VSYGYDAVGRLTQVTTASGTVRRTDFRFDENGNRTAKLARVLPDDPESAAAVESYSSDARSNQLDGITGSGGSRSFVYEGRGNLSSETRSNGPMGGTSISAGYDGHGRLTSYASSGNASLSHVYNGLDDRIATTTTSGGASDTRRFVYATDGRVIGEYGTSAADIKAEFIWMTPSVGDEGDDGLGGYMPLAVATIGAGGSNLLTWVHANHMGVPILYSSATGTPLQGQPADYAAPGFPGQSRTLSDLYYNRYRDYDPTTGRYIQADPIGLAGGASPYSYAGNNPLSNSDPHGLMTKWEYLTGTDDQYRVNIMNGIAGISDAFSFGLTDIARDILGLNGEIHDCNPFYNGGSILGSFTPAGFGRAGVKVVGRAAESMGAKGAQLLLPAPKMMRHHIFPR
jgi:RHS repeat-associated protein